MGSSLLWTRTQPFSYSGQMKVYTIKRCLAILTTVKYTALDFEDPQKNFKMRVFCIQLYNWASSWELKPISFLIVWTLPHFWPWISDTHIQIEADVQYLFCCHFPVHISAVPVSCLLTSGRFNPLSHIRGEGVGLGVSGNSLNPTHMHPNIASSMAGNGAKLLRWVGVDSW